MLLLKGLLILLYVQEIDDHLSNVNICLSGRVEQVTPWLCDLMRAIVLIIRSSIRFFKMSSTSDDTINGNGLIFCKKKLSGYIISME